jgi:hypothetical protein
VRTIALRLTVLLCAFAAVAQNGLPSEGKATSPTTVASPLDGNWQITGNREYKQYPLISMVIHVNGKQVTGYGDRFSTCPTDPEVGGGGSFSLTGEIGPDSSFTLRPRPYHRKHGKYESQLTITGKVPALGSTSWSGTYTITGKEPKCSLDQGGAFTASRLAPLAGTFSGPMFAGIHGQEVKLNITVKQGEFVSHEGKVGPAYIGLPLTGSITVEGSPCFRHGTADAQYLHRVQGDLAYLRFKMEDESELLVVAFYTNPEETGLVGSAEVSGGRCDKQIFQGTLSRQ